MHLLLHINNSSWRIWQHWCIVYSKVGLLTYSFILIHTWDMIMQTDIRFAVVIYICGSRDFCQVINESTWLCYLHAIIYFLASCMPLVNDNQMLSCLQSSTMSNFALTIWLYSSTFLFSICVIANAWKKCWKTTRKEKWLKALKLLWTQVIVETAKMTLKVNWKQIEFETW